MRLFLLAALLAAPALAGQGPLPGGGRGGPPPGGASAGSQATMVVEPAAMAIAAWDADGDGRTTRAELAAGIARSFAAIANGAPTLGYIEYSDWARRWLGDANALPSPFEVDADHDNRITLPELQAQFAGVFDRLDKDHDGAVTRAEALTIRATIGNGPPGRGNGGRARGPGGGPPPGQ